MAGYWSCLLSKVAAGLRLRDAGTSLAAGDWSLTYATLFCCYTSTESTGSTVEGGFVGRKALKAKSIEGSKAVSWGFGSIKHEHFLTIKAKTLFPSLHHFKW